MPTQINFSESGVKWAVGTAAPVTAITYDTASNSVSVVDGGLDVSRTIALTQTVTRRANISTVENGQICPFSEEQDPRVEVNSTARLVIPTVANSTGAGVAADVIVEAPRAGKVKVPVVVSATMTENNRTYSVRPGTVAEHIESAIAALVQGKTAGDSTQALYSSNNYNLSSPAVTRNTNLFCNSLDWTGMSVVSWDGNSPPNNNACPAHLISPRHAITAHHYTPSEGTYVFCGVDGTLHTRTKVPGLTRIGTGDICLITLNADLPVVGASGVSPFSLLPQNFQTYLYPGYSRAASGTIAPNGGTIHCLKRKRWPTAASYDTMSISPLFGDGANWVTTNVQNVFPTRTSLYPSWNKEWQDGDSGSGTFLPILGQTVLVMTALTVGGGPAVSSELTAIRAAMETSIPGSTTQWPKVVNLSGFITL